jgi:hypothetical protein
MQSPRAGDPRRCCQRADRDRRVQCRCPSIVRCSLRGCESHGPRMWSRSARTRSHFPARPTKTLPRRSAGCRCHRSRPILWCPRGSRRSRHPRGNALAKSNQRCISAAHRAVIVVYRPASAAFPDSNDICSPRCASQPGFVTVFVAGGSCRRSNCRRALAKDRLASKTTKMPFMLGFLAPKKPVFDVLLGKAAKSSHAVLHGARAWQTAPFMPQLCPRPSLTCGIWLGEDRKSSFSPALLHWP